MLSLCVCGYTFLAWQSAHAAPRDAIAYLPQFSSYATYESQQADSNGFAANGYERVTSNLQFEWRPPPLTLRSTTFEGRLRYATELTDHTDFVLGSTADSRRDNYEFELNLRSDRLDVRHQLSRRDTWRLADGGASYPETEQSSLSGIALKLPFAALARINTLDTQNYSGPPNLLARGSERRNTSTELIYEPPKVQLGQRLSARTESLATHNPRSGTQTDSTAIVIDAQRQLELGAIGNLRWDHQHRETQQSDSIGGSAGAVTTLENQQRIMLEGRVSKTPLSYQLDVLSAVRDPGELPSDSRDVQQLRLVLDHTGPQHSSNLSFITRVEQLTRPGADIDSADTQNTLVWRFKPHPRLGTAVTYIQQDISDNILQRLSRDREYVDFTADYSLPGSGGTLLLNVRQESQSSLTDSNASSGFRLTNALNLGRAAHIAFDYEVRSFESAGTGSTTSVATDYLSTGVRYDVQAGPEVYLSGSWYQDVQFRDIDGFRYNKDRVNLQLNYRPSWNWQYSLMLNSGAETTRDLSQGTQRYDNSDYVRADVSFTF